MLKLLKAVSADIVFLYEYADSSRGKPILSNVASYLLILIYSLDYCQRRADKTLFSLADSELKYEAASLDSSRSLAR